MHRQKEIIVIEKDAIINTFICSTIRKMGHKIQAEYEDLVEAVCDFKKEEKYPNHILINLDSKWLKRKNKLPFLFMALLHVPVLLTSSLDYEDIQELISCNPKWNYLQKPYSACQLRKALELQVLN